jgi:hypothetical protein
MTRADRTGATEDDRAGPPPAPPLAITVTSAPIGPAKTKTTTAAGRPAGTTTQAATTTEILSSHEDGTSLPRPPADWANFGPRPVRPPTRVGRAAGRAGRLLGQELTLLVLGALALAAAVNWAALRAPARVLPARLADSALGAYVIAWAGHALGHDPARLWQANAFFPTPDGLAFADPLLGYAPLALVGTGPATAVLRFNVIIILVQALAAIGPYALARQLGAARTGAAVAALVGALAPWRLGVAGQVEVLSTGGLALALAMLARGHGMRLAGPDPDPDVAAAPPPVRPSWALAGWLVAAWQLSLGPSLGVVFGYVLAGATLLTAVWWAVRRHGAGGHGRRLLLADTLGLAGTAVVAIVVGRAYQTTLDRYPAAQRAGGATTSLRGLLTAPADSLLWGDLHTGARQLLGPTGLALLPGFTLCALALGGLVFSVWSVRARLLMLAGVVGSAWLALGAHGPGHGRVGYVWLAAHLPGLAGARPAYLVAWTTLLLALLAAGGVSALDRGSRRAALARNELRPAGWARAALLLPLALVLLEGLGTTGHPTVPQPPAALGRIEAPYLVLPSDASSDAAVLLWSTTTFRPVVNGAGPVLPEALARTRAVTADFPSAESIDYLRRLGVRTVVVRPGLAIADAAPPPDVTRDVTPDAVIFHL